MRRRHSVVTEHGAKVEISTDRGMFTSVLRFSRAAGINCLRSKSTVQSDYYCGIKITIRSNTGTPCIRRQRKKYWVLVSNIMRCLSHHRITSPCLPLLSLPFPSLRNTSALAMLSVQVRRFSSDGGGCVTGFMFYSSDLIPVDFHCP